MIALVATKNARRKYQIAIKRKAPAQPEEAFARALLQKITNKCRSGLAASLLTTARYRLVDSLPPLDSFEQLIAIVREWQSRMTPEQARKATESLSAYGIVG